MHDLSLGLGMRRVPYHRPSKSVDQARRINPMATQDDTYFIRSPFNKSSRSLSWLPSRRRASKSPVIVRSEHDLHRIVTPLPPVPAGLSSSSSSTRGSYESRVYNVSSTRLDDDDFSDATSLHESPVPCPRSPLSSRFTRSALGFYECFTDTEDNEALPRPASAFSHSDLVTVSDQHYNNPTATAQQEDEWSANARQLLQETEHAFEAVGNALNELQLASWLLEIPGPAAPSPVVPRHPKTSPLSPACPSRENLKPGPSHRAAPSHKIPSKLRVKFDRRALSESLSNALLGHRFMRVVADEMLTPARMEELKKRRENAQADARLLLDYRPSNESLQSICTDNEPFHLESLVSRIDASAERSLPALVEDKDMPSIAPLDQDVVHSDFSLQRSASKDDEEKEAADAEDFMNIDSFAFPTPPRNPARIALKASVDLLPTIPEVFATASDDMQPRQSQDDNRESFENDELVYLNGTDLSSANPSFRHGPITYQKPEAGKDNADEVDETVDWMAFQMAILGGAGDLVSGMYEDDQNEMADEMAEWFETFGFETHGQLISSGVPSSRDSRDSSETIDSSSPPSINSDCDLPIPVLAEEPDYSASGLHGIHGPYDTIRFFRSSSLRPWGMDGEPKRYSLRETILSPPKPLVVGGDAPEDVSESVAEMAPMGCNMEHDLDEYLRWERDHVYGGVI